VREKADVLKPHDWRHTRRRSRRNHESFGGQPPAIDIDRVGIREASPALHQRHMFELTENGRVFLVAQLLHQCQFVSNDRRDIKMRHRQLDPRDPVVHRRVDHLRGV
jgi:hypothetical protein